VGCGVEDLKAALLLEARRQRPSQCRFVDVAVDRVHDRAEGAQLLQRRAGEEVTGVDHRLGGGDDLDAAPGQPPAALGRMGVGDHGNHNGERL
jgi:hypothetical protein